MQTTGTEFHDKQRYYRLVSLWAICEAFAGGLMHGVKLPFTGLMVSSLSVSCIMLIGYHVNIRFAIIRATLLVCIAKLALSPHSPPTAYIAVCFQGLLGQLLLHSRKSFRVKSVLLAALSLTESALQRLLVLVIIYGTGFWQAVNEFIGKIAGSGARTDYAQWMAAAYLFVHLLAGLFIGFLVSGWVSRLDQIREAHPDWVIDRSRLSPVGLTEEHPVRKKGRWKMILFLCWLLLLAAWLIPGLDVIPKGKAMSILTRSVLIVGAWLIIVSPLLMKWLTTWLKKKEKGKNEEMAAVMLLIPETRAVFRACWLSTAHLNTWERPFVSIKRAMVNLL